MKKIGIHTFSWSLSNLLESGLPPFSIVAGKDGRLYEVRHADLGTIIVPAENLRRLEEIPTGFQFNLPSIPGDLLTQAITFFRTFCRNGAELEVMVSFFYHPSTQEYVVDCPYQKVSSERIEYEELNYENEGFIEVLQLHSHHCMEAYFSEVDNNDEKRFLLYGVIGKLDQTHPDMKLRAGVNGYFYEMPLDYIFHELNLTRIADYPYSWHTKVTMR